MDLQAVYCEDNRNVQDITMHEADHYDNGPKIQDDEGRNPSLLDVA